MDQNSAVQARPDQGHVPRWPLCNCPRPRSRYPDPRLSSCLHIPYLYSTREEWAKSLILVTPNWHTHCVHKGHAFPWIFYLETGLLWITGSPGCAHAVVVDQGSPNLFLWGPDIFSFLYCGAGSVCNRNVHGPEWLPVLLWRFYYDFKCIYYARLVYYIVMHRTSVHIKVCIAY